MTAENEYVVLAAILGFFFAAATAKAASDKGASARLWFVVGLILPGLGLVIALLLDAQPLTKECPRCVRPVEHSALVCGYCGHEFIGRGGYQQNQNNVEPHSDLDRSKLVRNGPGGKQGRRVA